VDIQPGQSALCCIELLFTYTAAAKRSELRQHYCEGQEDQLGALGLVVNVIAL